MKIKVFYKIIALTSCFGYSFALDLTLDQIKNLTAEQTKALPVSYIEKISSETDRTGQYPKNDKILALKIAYLSADQLKALGKDLSIFPPRKIDEMQPQAFADMGDSVKYLNAFQIRKLHQNLLRALRPEQIKVLNAEQLKNLEDRMNEAKILYSTIDKPLPTQQQKDVIDSRKEELKNPARKKEDDKPAADEERAKMEQAANNLKDVILSSRKLSDDQVVKLSQEYKSLLDYVKINPEFLKGEESGSSIKYLQREINRVESYKAQIKQSRDVVLHSAASLSDKELHEYLNKSDSALHEKNYQVILDHAQDNQGWRNAHESIVAQAKIEKIIDEIPVRAAHESFKEYCKQHYQVILDYAAKYPEWKDESNRYSYAVSLAEEEKKSFRPKPTYQVALSDEQLSRIAYTHPQNILNKTKDDHEWAREHEHVVEYAKHRHEILKGTKLPYRNKKIGKDMELAFMPETILDRFYEGDSSITSNDLLKAKNNMRIDRESVRQSLRSKLRENEENDLSEKEKDREAFDKGHYGLEYRV